MKTFFTFVGLVLSVSAMGQPANPYAGQQIREIKALSQAEIDGYLDGKGMGLAKAAELNGYPGPKHVLELADELGLSAEQREQTRAIFEQMRDEAIRLGKRIVAKERALDAAFAGGEIDQAALESVLQIVGDLKARLRAAHLSAHLSQRKILTEAQLVDYEALRGYGGRADGHHGGQGHH